MEELLLMFSEEYSWIIPATFGALLSLIISSVGIVVSHQLQIEREKERDERNRAWLEEDREREKLQTIFRNQAAGVNSCLIFSTNFLQLSSDFVGLIVEGNKTTKKLVMEMKAAYQDAIKTNYFFYIVKDAKLAVAGEELFSSMNEMDECITNLIQARTKENREIAVSSFKTKSKKFGEARNNAIIRLTELESQ